MVPGFCKEKQTLSEQHTDSLVDILYPFQVHCGCIFAWQRFARPKIITTHITKALSISHRIHGMNRIFTYVCIYIYILYIYHKYQPFMDRSIYRTRPTLYGEASQRMQGRKCIRLFPPWAAIHLQPIGGWFGSPVVFCSQHEDVFGTEKEHGI